MRRSPTPSLLYLVTLAGTLAMAAACGARSRPQTGPSAQIEVPPPAAAMAPLRRLTQEQYRNTIRDLLGVRDLGVDLTIDEGVGGFFSNTVAPVSELHLEKYGRAAEVVARQAVSQLPRLLPCDPAKLVGQVPSAAETTCARGFVERFGRRAFRRPLRADEVALYEGLYRAGRTDGDAASGVRLVLQAMLQSPNFLYLMEPVGQAPVAGKAAPVTPVPPFALASRLAYFLWNTTPDEALLDAAQANRLRAREEIAGQVNRMLADPRFRDTVHSFHLQWLDLTEFGSIEKRNKIYPLFSHQLRADMQEETKRFVDHVVREGDGRLETLLSAPFSFVSGSLHDVYGVAKPDKAVAATWRKVDLGGNRRAGLLTQASVMTAHAHWDKPSLVLRGKVIREKLFCTVLPPPPPDVNNALPQADPKVSTRERFEDHRSDIGCAKCHRMIDPLGIPFENYDGIGAWRTMDGPAAVDPTSEISGTARSDGPVKDALELARKLATSDEVRDCVALQWFRYAIGRDEQAADEASIARARHSFRESGFKVPALIAAIALTDSFRYVQTTR